MIELYIGTERLDLAANENIILQDSIGRIGDFSEREGQITNDFEIAWTARNIAIMGFHDRNTSTSTFPYTKQDAILRQRGTELSRGFVQLTKIDQRGRTATLSFYGTNASPFSLLGSDSIRDLDLSEYNHTWDEANITASFTNTEGYIYPFVDSGKWENIGAISTGTAVVEWFPAVYQKTIIQKIFDRIGFKLSGPFTNEFAYTSAIIPVVRAVSSEFVNTFASAEATNNQIIQYVITSPTGSGAGGGKLSFQQTSDSTHFDVVNNNYTATTTTNELLEFSANFNILTWSIQGTAGAPITVSAYASIYNGATLLSKDLLHQTTVVGAAAPTPSPLVWNKSITVPVVSSDTVYARLEIEYTGAGGGSNLVQVVYNIEDYLVVAPNLVVDAQLAAGDTWDLAYNLPDISQRDFLLDMIVRHSLMVTTDNYTQTVSLTPARNVFKALPNAPDWSEKVNTGKTAMIDFVEVVQNYGKSTQFQYVLDENDYVQKLYFDEHGEYWGNGAVSIANEFLANEVLFYESKFSASVHRKIFTSDPVLDRPYVPVIPYFDEAGERQEIQPRILYVVPDTDLNTAGGGTSVDIGVGSYNDIAYAYFTRPKLNNALDIYVDGLAFSKPAFGTSADDTLIDAWYREIVRIWNEPRYIETTVRLQEYEYQTLDFLTPVYIDKEYLSGYFVIDEVESYNGFFATLKLIQVA